jgi:Cu+-exporting ATPase
VQITGRKKVDELKVALPALESGLECLLFVDGHYAAAVRFHDAPRKDSASFIGHLQPKHGVAKVMLVSGDRESEVKYLAESVGITELHAGRSPEEKVAIVKEETAKGPTLFVGDGINDAPALAQAQIGIAMGTGTDVAMQSAGMTLVKGDLQGIVRARRLSRAVMRNIRQNLFFAFIFNALAIPLAAGVLYPAFGLLLNPMIASAAMSMSSVLVISNALRLRKVRL